MKPTLKVTSDITEQVMEAIKRFRDDSVLVGIPEEKTDRKPEAGKKIEDGHINNATILAINHFGSEKLRIPPRPVLTIGLRNAQDQIAEEMSKAAKEALSRGWVAVDKYYNKAGIIASNSVKKAINAQTGLKGPAEATLSRRKAAGFAGTKTLIVTGQLRNSITYVVKGKP
jgi:hypothetical protein